MSIRCGFFNSVNNDRKYDAEDMGKIFEGVINDGVFYNYKDKNGNKNRFKVEKVNNAMQIKVLEGKAWFFNRYFEVTEPEILTLKNGDLSDRIDAVCIKIDSTIGGRVGSLYIEKGTPNSNPVNPTISNTDTEKYIPIAYITVPAGATSSNNISIESNVGTDECPWATTTLDPRTGMFIYEGESSVDPVLNEIKTYDFDLSLSDSIQNHGGNPIGRRGSITINPETIGINNIENCNIICNITDAYTNDQGHYSLFGYLNILSPLGINIHNNNIVVSAKYHRFLDQTGALDTSTPTATVKVHMIIIEMSQDE